MGLPGDGVGAGDAGQPERRLPCLQSGGTRDVQPGLWPHRQHRLGGQQRGQPQRQRLQCQQSRCHRPDQITGQGTGADRHPRELRHARSRADPDF